MILTVDLIKIRNGENMRISKSLIEKSLQIFDKHFPKDKKMPINEKKQIVRFFLELHALGVKVASNGKWYMREEK
jgi:hypothetical protein